MMPDTEHDTIAVTLKLEPEVHEFFSKKARKAGVGLETYLSSTLAVVLGCKAFDQMSGLPHKAQHREKCC